jgi:serine/threonine protein kinase
MGLTYKAFDTELKCPVALKVISERYLHDSIVLRRFLREARAATSSALWRKFAQIGKGAS